MKEYEINEETLAIIPITDKKVKVMEIHKDFTINININKIIDDSCKYFGSSYKGRFEGTKNLIGISHKSPIIIEESRKIIFFPTKSPRISTCIWISFKNIESYEGNSKKSIINFSCGKNLKLNISYNIIDNQVLRSTRLESVLRKRLEK